MPAQNALDLLDSGKLLTGALFRSMVERIHRSQRLAPGTRLGAFCIVDEIAAGGMGVVYRADRVDGQYRQSVAIKCVSARDADGLALFRRERQILAEIRHPHIARLLDGGQLPDGRLWFAMELIEGDRIDVHARARSLTLAARINLLRQAIDAVSFAHQRLLLHRDIKPGNVLVDGDGRVKLLDFGIASLIGDSDTARAYTPDWASPEQIDGAEIGLASDQYQLGRLLEHLVRASDTDLRSAPRPELSSQRRAELHSIIHRATAKDARQRYGSVIELDADLARWLAIQPVLAHGAGPSYTLRCAVRRHPWIAAGTSAAVLVIVALLLGFSWRLAQQRDLARAEAARATREAQTAAAVSRFLQDDLLALADPNISQDVGLKVQTLVQRAAASVDTQLVAQPEIAAQIHTTLARSLRGLGELNAAGAQFDRAMQLSATLPADHPQRLELALWQGDLDLARGQFRAAYSRLLDVAQLATAAYGGDSRLALEASVRAHAAQFELGDQVAAIEALQSLCARLDKVLGVDAALSIYALNRLAIMYNSSENIAQSERVRAEHLARATRVYGAEHSTTLTGQLNRAVLLRKLGRVEEPLAEAQAAELGLRKVFGSPSIASLHALNVRSRILQDSGRLDEAIALQRETLAGRISLLGEQHQEVAFSHVNLGGMLIQNHDYAAGITEYERALAIREVQLGPEHVDVVTNLTLLADSERLRGRLEDAERYAQLAVSRGRRALAANRPELANALFRHAQIQRARQQFADAMASASEALTIYQRSYPADHPRLGLVRAFLDTH